MLSYRILAKKHIAAIWLLLKTEQETVLVSYLVIYHGVSVGNLEFVRPTEQWEIIFRSKVMPYYFIPLANQTAVYLSLERWKARKHIFAASILSTARTLLSICLPSGSEHKIALFQTVDVILQPAMLLKTSLTNRLYIEEVFWNRAQARDRFKLLVCFKKQQKPLDWWNTLSWWEYCEMWVIVQKYNILDIFR